VSNVVRFVEEREAMAVQMKPETPIKAVVSVAQMCRLLKMSRSQFYWHIKRGTFHAPLYLASNKRPYFTAAMVEDNQRARETGVGVNGEYVIFYECRPNEVKALERKPKANRTHLVDGLKRLGLPAVTVEQVEAALAECYPTGTVGHDEITVLRTLLKHLKRTGAG
jgi:predicted DNA-binding transcriptional regulator AlpA